MKNKVWIVLVALVFLGCTKTINIVENRGQAMQGEPIVFYEEIPIYEAQPHYEIRTRTNENPYRESPSFVVATSPFNITPLEVYDKMQEASILLLDEM